MMSIQSTSGGRIIQGGAAAKLHAHLSNGCGDSATIVVVLRDRGGDTSHTRGKITRRRHRLQGSAEGETSQLR